MTVFARMEVAIAHAMQDYDAGAIVTLEPFAVAEDLQAFREDSCHLERQYIDAHPDGSEVEAFHVSIKHDGCTAWAGDIHVFRWPTDPTADPMFFLFYAA